MIDALVGQDKVLPSIDFLEESVRRYSARQIPLAEMRESAVLILICESDSELYIALQVRTNTVAHHKGEISFPGGRRDAEDSDLSVTALRETNEEMGVESDEIALIGRLDDTCTIVSNYRISPFVGLLREIDLNGLFSKADAEVRDVLIVKLDTLMSPESRVWHMV
jgi:8-oxo-dGTP pyrophosphatase MutT (NUDIX family)